MYKILITLGAVAVVAFIGCGTGITVPDGSLYFPLAVGNTWEYDGPGDDLSWAVAGYAEHDCGAALWAVSVVSGNNEYTFYWRAADDGLYEYIDT